MRNTRFRGTCGAQKLFRAHFSNAQQPSSRLLGNAGENFSPGDASVIPLMFGHVLAWRVLSICLPPPPPPPARRVFARETIHVAYLHAISDWGEKFRGFFAREFRKYARRERRKRARRRREGTHGRGAKVSLENPVTFRRHWGVFTACGLANPPPFLHLPPPFSHHDSPFLANSRVVPLSSSFLFPPRRVPLRPSLHPAVGRGARFILEGEFSPRTDRPKPVSTLVINTNCSIQTFEMCLTFLWHVIPSSLSLHLLFSVLLSLSLSFFVSLFVF